MKRFACQLALLAFGSFTVACGGGGGGGGNKPEPDAGQEPEDAGNISVTPPRDASAPRDATVPMRTSCGNGRLESGEACDDGNDRAGDGCDADCKVEPSFHCVVAGSDCEQCGNAIVESAEQCDDGNADDGDGCSDDCQLETSFTCPVPGQPCEQCGNGVVEANERCDEGALADGVGCSDDCRTIDDHFACLVAGEACVECGNGVVEGDEQCDDGNTDSGDGCVFNCSAKEPGFRCAAAGGACTLCGDGMISGEEACDDGNFASDDGCSSDCDLEPGATCLLPGVLCSVCGNGYIEYTAYDDGTMAFSAPEECDDGNQDDGDGCSASCAIEDDGGLTWQCPIPGFGCGRCGDGVVQDIEGCDDGVDALSGDPTGGDGCSADCTTIEPNYRCPDGGGTCVKCGDGVVDSPLESCDDANTLSGDGCNRLCQIETNVPWVCPVDGQPCELCGNGVIEAHEVCDDGNHEGSDGCSADCKTVEAHYNCFFPGFACAQCGDGQLQPGERCDEGDLLDGSKATAGCNDQCQVVAPWTCPIANESCVQCGDNVIGAAESCEDGNTLNNDGCSATCQIEPGYDCSGGSCLAAACGDGFRAGNEECDDGNHKSGDGCNVVCDVEAGWSCDGNTCHRTVCGDGAVEGAEQCDDGKQCSNGTACSGALDCTGIGDQLCKTRSADGCSATCQFEPGYYCPVADKPCVLAPCGDGILEGAEQCDDGKACSDGTKCTDGATCALIGDTLCKARSSDGCSATCNLEAGKYCPIPGQPCVAAVCGNGKVEGLEQCDDGASAPTDGCDGNCKVETFYRCKGEPSVCKPILEFVSIRRFNISQVSPAGLNYEPDRRAFAGHKSQSSQDPIELCLDGTIIDPTDTTAGPFGTITPPVGPLQALPVSCADDPDADPCYQLASRPVTSGTLVGSTYDPFTDHYLFLTTSGQHTYLTDAPRDFDATTQDVADFQVELNDLSTAADLTVGEDGDLYIADSADVPNPNPSSLAPGMIKVFPRRRNGSLDIVVPDCVTTPEANCTSFSATPTAAKEWSAATEGADVLSGLFTVPGESLLGVFNAYQGAVSYSGSNMATMPATLVTSSEYFSFFDPTLATKPPLYGRSALPGLLFDLGTNGTSYQKYSKSAETAADGGSFIICPLNPSEDCQLFARTCFDDADCADIVPGTSCDTTAPVPYCHAAGDARDDGYQVDRDSAGTSSPVPLDVLANDTLSESACIDPNMTILSICGDGVTEQYETDHPGSCADDSVESGTPVLTPGGTVTYDSPDDGKCGFVDTFTYTVDLGGGVIDTATVRVLIACVCGDSVVDSNEQCDQGSNNGAAGTINTHGTVDTSDDTYYRCGDSCLYNVFCGDGYIVFPEECDDKNQVNGDGCSQFCKLESVCGNKAIEGVEQCDDGMHCSNGTACTSDAQCAGIGDALCKPRSGDQCNDNCRLPVCGDGNVDVQKGETCDDGNLTVGDGCSNTCHVEAVCGNHVTELGEDCDDGNHDPGDGCSATCKVENVCGNDAVEGSEACDGTDTANSTCPTIGGTQIECTNAEPTAPNICVCANYCGDGQIGGLEECDDGLAGSASCRAADSAKPCTLIRCGDGSVDGSEECDDGNTNPSDGCTNDCKVVAICGNGTVEGSEECDDHNNVSGDGCSSACKSEATVCGDGVLDSNEQCDDGNTTAGDGCDAACLIEGGSCGNGHLDLGEQCDDGNTTSSDGCSAACQLELCGNGVKNNGEECDDGNTMSGDGCSALCRVELL